MVGKGHAWGRIAAALVAATVVTLLTSATAYGAQPLGALTQLHGKAGCFTYNGTSEDGPGTCGKARGLAEAESAVLSPDGANLYEGSYPNSGAGLGAGYAIFKRNQSTGVLKQLSGKAGCLTTDGSSSAGAGTCTAARGLLGNSGDGVDVAITSNGKWAYIAADDSPASLLIFHRNTKTGALKQLSGNAGCITTDGSSQIGAATCKTDAHLLDASGLTLSPDDRFLYVTGTGGSHQIEVYSRNKKTGALKDIECIAEAPAPSGCSTGRVVGDTQFIALSPNGKHAYAGQYSYGISVYNRSTSTGKLTQKAGTAGCITNNGVDNAGASTCASGRMIRGAFPLLVAPNGKTLYDSGSRGFATLHINSDGTLKQLSGTNGCMTSNGLDQNNAPTCAVGRAVYAPYGGAISPDGRTLYLSDYQTAGGLAVFSLNRKTGVATQLSGNAGCITSDGTTGGPPGTCANGRAVGNGYGTSVSSDGRFVYQATDSSTEGGLAIYHRKALKVRAVP